jgi:hypothetical protein
MPAPGSRRSSQRPQQKRRSATTSAAIEFLIALEANDFVNDFFSIRLVLGNLIDLAFR